MNIWLAALCSLGILGASAIIFALGARFIEWAFDNDHMEACGLTMLIVLWVVLAICIYIEGGAT